MNTLNNTIAVQDAELSALSVKAQFEKAKDDGFTMIVIDDRVYSVDHYIQCAKENGERYFLNYLSLFKFDSIQPVEEPKSPKSSPIEKEHVDQQFNQVVKFNKSFEALYNISMKMADECIGIKTTEARFEKLEEEYQELIEEFSKLRPMLTEENFSLKTWEKELELIKGEFADVLFVLLHIMHRFGYKPFDLLHKASSKMLSRMNDPEYKAKN